MYSGEGVHVYGDDYEKHFEGLDKMTIVFKRSYSTYV